MKLDYSSDEIIEYDGIKFLASQFKLISSNLNIHSNLVSRIDTESKKIYFRIPEDGDLIQDLYIGRLIQRIELVAIRGKALEAFLPYSEIEIALYKGQPNPVRVYKEKVTRPVNEELKQAYKEILLEKGVMND